MKTQSVSFQGRCRLNINNSVSAEVRNAIETSPAMKRFSKMYDAEVYQMDLGSSTKRGTIHAGLLLDNVKPKNIFVAIFDILTGRKGKRYQGIIFNSHRDEAGLIKQLGKIKKNTFLKMIIGKH